FDPTLVLRTKDVLATDLGVKSNDPVAIDTVASRQVLILPPGDSGRVPAPTWAYTTSDPGAAWVDSGFDDTSWSRGVSGFGTPGTPALKVGTRWDSKALWLRTRVEL